jgi:dihydropyrimidinase
MREFRARTDGESAVDYALSSVITGQQDDPAGELPALIAAGVPTAKAFMVYDFRLTDDRLFAALQAMGRHGGMLQVHCENATIIDALTERALDAGDTGCRHHALSRPTYAEAEATHRAIALAQAAGASVYVVHLSCADALAEVAAAKARGWPVYAETCPQYLSKTDAAYQADDEAELIRSVISPPLRSDADRQALWLGLARGGLDLVASDHIPDRLAVDKQLPAPPFPQISNGAPGIETLLAVTHTFGPAAGRMSLERMVDVLSTTPARLFGLPAKGAVEAGRDADLVLFDPAASRVVRQAELHHFSDFTPYEETAVRGAVRTVLLRGRPVVSDGIYVGGRGRGRFLERHLS